MKKSKKAAGMFFLAGLLAITGCQKEAMKTKETRVTRENTVQEERKIHAEQVTEPEFKTEGICGLKVEQKGQVSYQLSYEPKEDRQSFLYWDISVPYHSYAIVDTEALYKLLERFQGIDWNKLAFTKSKDVKVTDSNAKITVSYVDGKVFEEMDQDEVNANTFTILIGDKNKSGQYYCAFQGKEEQVFLINTPIIDGVLNQKPFDLILKIPYVLDMDTVKKVKIEGLKKEITMEHKDGSYKLNGKKVKDEAYKELYSTLMLTTVIGEYHSGLKEGEELFNITYQRTKKSYQDYKVQFIACDEKKVMVKVNGEAYLVVSREDVELIMKKLEKI